jgi:hypothetical protein
MLSLATCILLYRYSSLCIRNTARSTPTLKVRDNIRRDLLANAASGGKECVLRDLLRMSKGVRMRTERHA